MPLLLFFSFLASILTTLVHACEVFVTRFSVVYFRIPA